MANNNSNNVNNNMSNTNNNQSMNNPTRLICGNCGAEIPIPQHTIIAIAQILARDLNLGTVVLPTIEGAAASCDNTCGADHAGAGNMFGNAYTASVGGGASSAPAAVSATVLAGSASEHDSIAEATVSARLRSALAGPCLETMNHKQKTNHMQDYTEILTGADAKRICNEILAFDDYSSIHLGAFGYWHEQDSWVAFDNTDGNCWMEEFSTEDAARDYAKGTLDIMEYYDNK